MSMPRRTQSILVIKHQISLQPFFKVLGWPKSSFGFFHKMIRVSLVTQMVRICLQFWRPGFNPQIGKIPWRRACHSTPVFLLGESHGQRSLAGYSPRGHKESDTTERLSIAQHLQQSFFLLECTFSAIVDLSHCHQDPEDPSMLQSYVLHLGWPDHKCY